ncbi:hypothetical protein ACFVU2_10670 [Leifsonia sp. NPDC058194]|uniref:hypothetical protein n=1 Tax=Leifsonia sp. NPDC058194 TaxID=3346374 RepID=UPI0036D87AAE
MLSIFVVIGTAIGAGFAARAARQRAWLVILVGVSITLGAALMIAVLLTPVPASS